MHNKSIEPVVLTILDGWGYSEETKGNAIKLASTPTMDKIWEKFPTSLLNASGEDVGLPENQMGNSEVGHTTIGAGRTINQDLIRIQKSIRNGDFFNNIEIHKMCNYVTGQESKLHVIGLCSDGGVHSHINHLKALIKILKEYKNKICLHLITDGRDTKPEIATKFLDEITSEIKNSKHIKICTISGRYYSMDRDCRWSRTEQSYKVLTEDTTNLSQVNYEELIKNCYRQGISDEFIRPTRLTKGKIDNKDGIIFFNFRPDRVRQLVQCLAKDNFKGFETKEIKQLRFLTFTEYDSSLKLPVIFRPHNHQNFIGQIISKYSLKQLRLAETEKYAHVTYFFNGGVEEPFPGEDRELIPSPKVETYDEKPEMSAQQITESLINAIDKNIYKFIVVNYANPDMIGHTGDLRATVEAISVVDNCINQVIKKVQEVQGSLIVTADHGNADYMIDINNQPCKSHSINPVPFILVTHKKNNNYSLKNRGNLADIAPTILDLLEIDIPEEMDGKSLISNSSHHAERLYRVT